MARKRNQKTTPRMKRRAFSREKYLAALLLAILPLVCYLPVLQGGFVWDDDKYVTENQLLKTPVGLARIWLEPGATVQYYPLVFTSFWVEYHLWGLSPTGYHAVYVLLHVIVSVLL